MRKIAHIWELEKMTGLPVAVVNVIREAVTILDAEYGENRDVESGYGGYVLVLEDERELEGLQQFHIDMKSAIPEYVDVVFCDDKPPFASCLLLQGSDFGVLLVMPFSILPETVKQYLPG